MLKSREADFIYVRYDSGNRVEAHINGYNSDYPKNLLKNINLQPVLNILIWDHRSELWAHMPKKLLPPLFGAFSVGILLMESDPMGQIIFNRYYSAVSIFLLMVSGRDQCKSSPYA